MSIEALIQVVPPPAHPSEPFGGPWDRIEALLGMALPPDYKEFSRLYGSGYFLEFLGVYITRTQNPNTRLVHQVNVATWSLEQVFPPDELPHPLWPAPGGLMAFGVTDNGDELFWLTKGAPETWKVVVFGRDFMEFETFDCGVTEFLAGLASGRLLPKSFPSDLLPCDRPFIPDAVWEP